MLLRVQYLNDTYDMVNQKLLNDLIESRKIKKFNRSGEWVDLETGPIRRLVSNQFVTVERRSKV